MAGYDVSNIIPINVRISPSGLGFANFASAMLFAPESELPVGFDVDTFRVYSNITDLSVDFPSTSETYKSANRWLGGIPSTNELKVWATNDLDADWTATLDKARNEIWWFWSFFTAPVYADVAISGDVEDIAAWSESNAAYFMNCQTTASATAIRDVGETTDIASVLTTSGYRYSSTHAHFTDPYAGISLTKWFAAVNYSATNSTITGEGKKLAGVAAESLTSTEYAAMNLDTKKCNFYTVVELQGSTDTGRSINTRSHSSFGEYIDDIVNLEAFVNSLRVALYNVIQNQPAKLGQDPAGQAVLIGTAKAVCEQYIANGYLGPRNYIDSSGEDAFTIGYEILTQAEDILNLSPADRADRKSAPLLIQLFRKGAIHQVAVTIDVF